MRVTYNFKAVVYLVLLSLSASAQPSLFFKGFYSSPSYTFYSSSSSIDTLSQNSFVFGGLCIRFANPGIDTTTDDSYILKNEVNGLTKWFKKYHLHGSRIGFSDIKTDKNKDILICGYSTVPTATVNDGIILKTDSNGLIKWSKRYPKQEIFATRPLRDGDIAVFATDSTSKMKLCLLDINGNVKWCKKQISNFGTQYYGCRITEGKNKDLLFYGYDGRAFAILMDSLGNKKKDLNMFNPNSIISLFYSGINFFNNGYFMCGIGQGNSNYFTGNILRLDNSLNILWYKNLITANYVSEFFDISTFNDNSLVILTEPEGHGSVQDLKRMGLTFIDSNGVVRKNLLFTSDSVDHLPLRFLPLKNGNILFNGISFADTNSYGWMGCYGITDTVSNGFCGFKNISYTQLNTTQNFTFNNYNFINSSLTNNNIVLNTYLPFDCDVKYFCSSGPVGPYDPLDVSIKEERKDSFLKLFPNPANETISIVNIEYEKRFLQFNSKLKITNTMGITIYETTFGKENSLVVSVKDFTEGVYFVSLILVNGERVSKKFIVKH
ncbi:T9SS type A sorting domain-containing protein [Sediminibacterium sp.]|uniref:T9SS type A sorting domain-containing protein n=1 Tax=Sediminibacterium sp. TaxID=1917865 RepID=UPI00271C6D82|nr:T9SS type A sorting domain-containing protein [Sediminibacterium sp.]MDO9000328.1 T9SS type A sorting domain-containing protein [Bacteroidota bacterium]MDP3147103.1 T9SS type A sorting domain-containing protein [Bacteroidota bacterium]MDP3567368.1 T9SS type A sorting domain-containing protein [Sediminibacterium sp.]